MTVRPWVVLVLAVVAYATIVLAWWPVRDGLEPPEGQPAIARYETYMALIAGAFPLAMFGLSFLKRLDGFAMGSIVLAVAIEVMIYWGWARSPQAEKWQFFLIASGLPFVLIVATLLFNALQREA